MTRIRFTEVGPRDGLQHERCLVATDDKVRFVDMLSASGVDEVEVTSFVSPKWVPQLADGAEVLARIARRPGVACSALVPNERGLDAALAARVDKVSVFVAATDGFSQRNTAGSVEEVLARLNPVVARAVRAGLPVRGYISCIVRCPFDGPVDPAQVASVARRLKEAGVTEIDLGDTIGAADVASIERLYAGIGTVVAPGETTLHLHDTGGNAIACALRAAALGVRSFDGSASGLGGCPFAPGSPGNVASEALLEALAAHGYGIAADAGAIHRAGLWMRAVVGGGCTSS